MNKSILSRAIVVCTAFWTFCVSAGEADGSLTKLHETRWQIDGKPVLGTYGAERLEDLQGVDDVGMNLVLAGEKELDPSTPEGAFCRAHGIKVMPHLTSFLYHGVRLREPVSAEQRDIPLYCARGPIEQKSKIIQIDDEFIRYEKMTDTALLNCERGANGTKPAAHREGVILLWPEALRAEVKRIKDSPNLYGYYVLDDSPGDALSALRGMYKVIHEADPNPDHPVCAGFGDAGSVINLDTGVCDIMFIYWYPVGTKTYDRERTAQEVQHMLATARRRVPGIPFMGIYQAFDGRKAKTGQGVPAPDQMREEMEDFVREGACGLVSFICHNETVPGWADIAELGDAVQKATREIKETGGLVVRPETAAMKQKRIQPMGHWETPLAMPGYVPAWNVVGPFEAAGDLLNTVFPPEDAVDAAGMYDAIAIYEVRCGKAGWRVRETTSGILGVGEFYNAVKNGVAYACCDVTNTEERAVQMRVCTDDDAWIKVNGKEVYRFAGVRGLEIDKDIVPLVLPSGTSRIEVKICNKAGMWAFFMRFTDTEGKPLEGLKFEPAGG